MYLSSMRSKVTENSGLTTLNSKGGQAAAFAVSLYLPAEYHVPLPIPCCTRYPC